MAHSAAQLPTAQGLSCISAGAARLGWAVNNDMRAHSLWTMPCTAQQPGGVVCAACRALRVDTVCLAEEEKVVTCMMLLGRLKARFSKAGTTGTVLVKGLPMLDLAFACARVPAFASSPSSVDRPAGT